MAIRYSEEKRIFTLDTAKTTYQMMADEHGVLLHLYYGRKAVGDMDCLLTFADRGFSGNPDDLGTCRTYSLDALPQEFPTSGTGDFRSPALIIEDEKGFEGCDLRYDSHTIKKGKYALKDLPAVYAAEDEAETLEICLKDEAANVEVYLQYGVLPELDIITRSVRIENAGTETLTITKALSANLDFLSGDYDILSFYGRHGKERNLERCDAHHGEFRIGSRRGMTSHQYNPLLILAEKDTNETAGLCFAMEFVYSGGFDASVEKDQYNQTRMQMGLAESKFCYPLEAGEAFVAPEVILSCSGTGFEGLSLNLATCVREHVCRGEWRDKVRPVLLNSWEGCYFTFTGDTIRGLAKEAAGLGIDLLVMDDGWFGKRDDDNSGLGDWYVNEEKLGGSLEQLISDVHDMGVQFGIWFEPEMVNEDSDLYRAHPDWALAAPDRKPVRSRNQLVLDFSRPEVVDRIFDDVCKIIDKGVDYVKWDFNRSISDVWSRTNAPGTVQYRFVLGLYRFLEQLNQKYPNLLIEGCSGGGGRFDAGMLYYTPQIWCSDNSDAISRLKIQYGTSFGYPMSAVGAHVSAVPNEQCGRMTSLNVRGTVAMAGTFGYELDPAKIPEEEKEEIRKQIAFRNKYAQLIFNGDYLRLSDPYKDPTTSWAFVSKDKSQAMLNIVATEADCNLPAIYVRMRGLEAGAMYKDVETGTIYPADALMSVGYPIPQQFGEYRAYQMVLEKI